MKTFRDIEFHEALAGGLKSTTEFENGYALSVIAGAFAYSTPRVDSTERDFFSKFEVAVFDRDGMLTREFFPEDHNDDVMGWQSEGQINALMLLVQAK